MSNVKNIGLVVAVEIKSVLEKYGTPIKTEKINAFNVLTYQLKENSYLHVVHCGAGQIAAASATQFCISRLDCTLIINFGIVGGLTKDMSTITTCIVDRVIHYDFDTSAVDEGYTIGRYTEFESEFIPTTPELVDIALKIEPTLKKVVAASGDKFIGTSLEKERLHTTFGADICEMESAAIAITCHRNNVPMLLIKCVSDGCGDDPSEYRVNFEKSARLCFDITDNIIQSIM